MIACLLIAELCFAQQSALPLQSKLEEGQLEYYFALTEATKFYVYGDFRQSLRLYQECLMYKSENPAVFYQLGNLFLKTGDLGFAGTFFRKAFALDSKNYWYARSMAEYYISANKYDSAELVYKMILKWNPGNDAVRFELARTQFLAGSLLEALNHLFMIEQSMGRTKEVELLRHEIQLKRKRYRDADRHLNLAMVIDQNDPWVMKKRGDFFKLKGREDSASFWYERAFKNAPLDAGIVFSYSDFLVESGLPKQAATILADWMKNDSVPIQVKRSFLAEMTTNRVRFEAYKDQLDSISDSYFFHLPKSDQDLALYTDIQFRLGNFEKSANVLKQSLRESPLNSMAHEQLLFALNYLNQTDSLEKYAEMTRRLYSERPISYLFLGSTCYRKEKYKEGVEYLSKGVSLTDNRALQLEFYSLLAESYSKVGLLDMAIRSYELALEADKLNVVVNNNFAYLLATIGRDLDKAHRMSSFCVTNFPENSTYLDTYAWVLFKRKDGTKALKFMKRAMRFGGDRNAEILDHFGDILIYQGKVKRAVEVWKQAFLLASEQEKVILEDKIKQHEQRVDKR